MTIIRDLQASVENLNDITTTEDIQRYMVDDEMHQTLPGALVGLPEQVFIRELDDSLDVAVYIASEVLEALEQDDPHTRLHDGNLENFCVALEGVSHFVFLVWRAQLGRPVSPIELELQAEVDKFVGSWVLLVNQGRAVEDASQALCRVLFERYALRDEVPDDQQHRYHLASRAAQRFCINLTSKYRHPAELPGMQSEVREFYRLGLADKLAMI